MIKGSSGPMPIKKILPIVKPFTISSLGWEVFDRRAIPDLATDEVNRLWLEHVRILTRRNPSLRLDDICGFSAKRNDRRVKAFRDAQIARPALGWRGFLDEGGGVESEFQEDLRFPQLFLGVRSTDDWIGAIAISNIHIESESDGRIVANAFFFIGLPTFKRLGIGRTWAKIFDHILNERLHLADGRTLEVVQYNMFSSPAQRLMMNDDPDIKGLMLAMRPLFDSLGDPENRTEAVRFRRKSVVVRR